MNKDQLSIYKCYGHSKTRLRYHIILTTKYRRSCLQTIKDDVLESFKQCALHSDIKIHLMNLDRNHIHLLISFPQKYSISQTVNRLKQYTTNYLYRTNYDYLKKFYRSNKKKLWSESYFITTIGNISENKVLEYIKNQI